LGLKTILNRPNGYKNNFHVPISIRGNLFLRITKIMPS